MRVVMLSAVLLLAPLSEAWSHCDWVKGPVVIAGEKALEQGDVTPLLRWVRAEDESEIRGAFAKARAARATSPEAQEVADRWFLETLVRVHRASEGETFVGLRGEEYQPEPGIALADEAIAGGELTALEEQLIAALRASLRQRFAGARAAAEHADHNVAAGRESVRTYADFVHFVEAVHAIVRTEPGAAHHQH